MNVRLVEELSEQLLGLEVDGVRELWTSGKLRKIVPCECCGTRMHPGVVAFRPVGNQQHRAARICPGCARRR
jgi:hypothetical protein